MYKVIDGFDGVIRMEDGAYIPNDLQNRDWVRYLEWLAEGNVPIHG